MRMHSTPQYLKPKNAPLISTKNGKKQHFLLRSYWKCYFCD